MSDQWPPGPAHQSGSGAPPPWNSRGGPPDPYRVDPDYRDPHGNRPDPPGNPFGNGPYPETPAAAGSWPPPARQPYNQQPYNQQPYNQQPYNQQPYNQQPYAQQAPPTQGQTPLRPSAQRPGYRLSSDQFKPPRSRTPLLITGIVIAVVLAVVATGAIVAWRSDHPATAPSPSPTTSVPIPSTSGNAIDFVSDEGSGRLEVVKTTWTSTELLLKITLTCTKGEVQHGLYNFKAFDVNGTLYDSTMVDAPEPVMTQGKIETGQSVTGWIGFTVGRQDITLLLISEYGEAITAFAIKG